VTVVAPILVRRFVVAPLVLLVEAAIVVGSPLLGVVAVVGGWFVGLSALGDNSYFTHLATGRLILDTHHVPTTDPYTFTATGRAWVVQSWLASLLYGVVDRVGGDNALLLLKCFTTAVLAGLAWQLTRPARSMVPRVAILVVLLGIGKAYWSERPLTLGLILLCVVLLAAEGRVDPRWSVPVFWLWANVHGSFPLGLLAVALLAAGSRLDGGDPSVEVRVLKLGLVGSFLAAINPLGPRLLLFPLQLLSKQDVLHQVVEWQAPAFTSVADRLFLVLVVATIAVLARRPSWRTALVAMVFLPSALLGARNVVVASIVLAGPVAAGLSGIGALRGEARRAVFGPVAALLVAVALVTGASYPRSHPAFALEAYPVEAVSYAEARGLLGADHRLVTEDVVGNYLELRYGTSVKTFIDDRFDMLPKDLVDDYLTLLRGKPGWEDVLERRDADVIVWERSLPLAQLVASSPRWRIVYRDSQWILAVRR